MIQITSFNSAIPLPVREPVATSMERATKVLVRSN